MSKKKKNQIGKIFTITGLLLFAAALALSVIYFEPFAVIHMISSAD